MNQCTAAAAAAVAVATVAAGAAAAAAAATEAHLAAHEQVEGSVHILCAGPGGKVVHVHLQQTRERKEWQQQVGRSDGSDGVGATAMAAGTWPPCRNGPAAAAAAAAATRPPPRTWYCAVSSATVTVRTVPAGGPRSSIRTRPVKSFISLPSAWQGGDGSGCAWWVRRRCSKAGAAAATCMQAGAGSAPTGGARAEREQSKDARTASMQNKDSQHAEQGRLTLVADLDHLAATHILQPKLLHGIGLLAALAGLRLLLHAGREGAGGGT